MNEPLKDLFRSSRLLVLDFPKIPANTPEDENIALYFQQCRLKGENPTTPENRQRFNNHLLAKTGYRYLVSRYGEDRCAMLAGSKIASTGRTLHLGIDIFCKRLETVYAPCEATIVRVGREPENHSFGYYVILQPKAINLPFIFLGHLAPPTVTKGMRVKAGQPIGRLGDYKTGENVGWWRHVHLQMLTA